MKKDEYLVTLERELTDQLGHDEAQPVLVACGVFAAAAFLICYRKRGRAYGRTA